MMKKLFLTGAVALLLLSSCRSTRINALSTPMYSPAAQINEIRANVDIDMNKKIEGEASAVYWLGIKIKGERSYAEGLSVPAPGSAVSKLKSAAAFKAITSSKSDIIVHPNYVVNIEKFIFFKKITVTATGFSGKFTKFYQKEYCDPCKEPGVKLIMEK